MKKLTFLFVLLFVAALVFPVTADDLADVMSKGTMVFGTAPDYVPFVFYDENDELTGIDVALMKEVGRRMGVKVEPIDMAFDGLLDALAVGQVDVVGGALSKTDERTEKIDFSRVYYKGDAEFITKVTAPKPAGVSLMDFRGSKIGVQRGTSFDQWVKSNMVTAGFVGTRDVFSYSKVDDAVKAMDRGDVDFVLMDQDVYEDKYQSTGKYQIYYNGFAQENYAFGLRKDSSLTNVVNGHLANMVKDGTAQKIANKFFSMDYSFISPQISRPSQIATALPYVPPVKPVPTQVACVNSMSFVKDITIKDGQQMKPNEHFTKTWRIYNNGSCTWDSSYSFTYVSGDQMSGRNIYIPGTVKPGQTVDVSVEMIAPWNEGTYRGYWQMRSPQAQNFGQTIWAKIRVKGSTPVKPTATPNPSRPAPTVRSFVANPSTAPAGQVPSVNWNVLDADTIIIRVDGVEVYNGRERNGSGYFESLANGGDHYVELQARNVTDDTYAGFTYTAYADGPIPVEPPYINYFYPEFYAGNSGDVPTVFWSAPNAQYIEVTVDGQLVYSGDSATGSGRWDKLGVVGNHDVQLLARNITDDAYSSFTYMTNAPLMPIEPDDPFPVIPPEEDDPIVFVPGVFIEESNPVVPEVKEEPVYDVPAAEPVYESEPPSWTFEPVYVPPEPELRESPTLAPTALEVPDMSIGEVIEE